MTDLNRPLTSLIGLAWVFFLGTQEGVSLLSNKTIRLRLHATLFLHHCPLFWAARNQVTFPAMVTCWWLDEFTWINLVLSLPWGAEAIYIVVKGILFGSPPSLSWLLRFGGGRTLPSGVWNWQAFSMKFTLYLNEKSSANCVSSTFLLFAHQWMFGHHCECASYLQLVLHLTVKKFPFLYQIVHFVITLHSKPWTTYGC